MSLTSKLTTEFKEMKTEIEALRTETNSVFMSENRKQRIKILLELLELRILLCETEIKNAEPPKVKQGTIPAVPPPIVKG